MLRRTTSKVSNKANDETSKYMTKLEQEFDLGESLGEGGYGQIFKAKRKCDNNQFAIKIIKFDSNMEDLGTIRREANLLSKLSHSNIVRYFNSWIETAHVPYSEYERCEDENLYSEVHKLSLDGYIKRDDDDFEEEYYDEYDDSDEYEEDGDDDSLVDFQENYMKLRYLYIQMELCEKRNLRTAIRNKLYLEENKVAKYFREICEGLSYIHKNNIVHRDLKPENIFLTSDDIIKIGDFGLSKQISLENEFDAFQNDHLPYGSLTATCGTQIYIAPELFRRNRFNIKADIYSLGVTYFEMCSKPMTVMEQSLIFPLTQEKWKNINFPANNSNKKNLLKTLLHADHHERPTCEQILKVLTSGKSTEEIKEVIQRSRGVTNQERRSFERNLKSISPERTEVRNSFLKKAVEIFKVHGGVNIPMPTFVPSFPNCSNNLTTLLNTGGNSTSLANTSRIAFSYYVTNKRIQKIRRYSTEKVYEEGYFSPTELQECLFQIVSSEPDDFVTDAEMLHITHKLLTEIFPYERRKIIIVNHGLIFTEILRWCALSTKDSYTFTNLLISSTVITSQTFSSLQLDKKTEVFLQNVMNHYDFTSCVKYLSEFFKNFSLELIPKAFRQLKVIVENARKFGVNWTVYLAPLFVNQRNPSGLMFKVICGTQVVATGGRFDSLIRKCHLRKRKTQLNVSAVDVSFNVDSIVELLIPLHNSSRAVDVIIAEKNKAIAIPLYSNLLSRKVKCQILKEYIPSDDPTQEPLVIIHLPKENICVMYQLKKIGAFQKLDEVFAGEWIQDEFFEILFNILRTKQLHEDTVTGKLSSSILQLLTKLISQNTPK